MKAVKIYELTEDQLTETINDAVEIYIKVALKDKIITQEQHDTLSTHKIVTAKPRFWGRLYEKLVKQNDKELDLTGVYIHVVKMVG